MIKLYFDTENALFLVNGVVPQRPFVCGKGDIVEVFCQPETCDKSCCAPVYAKIFVGDRPHMNTDLLSAIDCGDGVFYIRARRVFLSSASGVDVVAQQQFHFDQSHTVTVYNDFRGHICMETDSYFYCCDSGLIASSEIRAENSSDGIILIVYSTLYDGKESAVIAGFTDDYSELLNVTADKIRFSEDGIDVERSFCDMQSRKTDTLYRYSEKENAYLAVSVSADRRGIAPPDELIPYAFLEAVIAADDEDAQSFLCHDLKQPVSVYKDYFGDFEIAEADFLEYEPFVVPVIVSEKNRHVLKRCKFTVKDGKITDMSTK